MAESIGCCWSGLDAAGEPADLSVDVGDAKTVLDEVIVDDYEPLDDLGDEAYIQDEDEIISIRWNHEGIGVLLQEQYGDRSQEELVPIAQAIDDDLPKRLRSSRFGHSGGLCLPMRSDEH